MLTAEWTYLNQPERLAELNRRFLQLAPVAAKQLQPRIEDMPLRAGRPSRPPRQLMSLSRPIPRRRAPARPTPAAGRRRRAPATAGASGRRAVGWPPAAVVSRRVPRRPVPGRRGAGRTDAARAAPRQAAAATLRRAGPCRPRLPQPAGAAGEGGAGIARRADRADRRDPLMQAASAHRRKPVPAAAFPAAAAVRAGRHRRAPGGAARDLPHPAGR